MPFLVLATHFAGGVFLGTALMHFLVGSMATFQGLTQNNYPFAFTLATAGYLIPMYWKSVIQWIFVKEVAKGGKNVRRVRSGHLLKTVRTTVVSRNAEEARANGSNRKRGYNKVLRNKIRKDFANETA